MPSRPLDRELVRRFLQELSASLDVPSTIRRLNISDKEAREMLEALAFGEGHWEKVPKTHHPKGPHEIYVDGASRGNPGKAGIGAVIKEAGRVVKRLRRYIGIATNNTAEYRALVMALEEAGAMGIEDVRVFADSELMVRQINGLYKVRSPDLKPLFDRVVELLNGFRDFKVTHIPREENAQADSLANEAIDRGV